MTRPADTVQGVIGVARQLFKLLEGHDHVVELVRA